MVVDKLTAAVVVVVTAAAVPRPEDDVMVEAVFAVEALCEVCTGTVVVTGTVVAAEDTAAVALVPDVVA